MEEPAGGADRSRGARLGVALGELEADLDAAALGHLDAARLGREPRVADAEPVRAGPERVMREPVVRGAERRDQRLVGREDSMLPPVTGLSVRASCTTAIISPARGAGRRYSTPE